MTYLWAHGPACDASYLFVMSSPMSKKLQDDSKMATTDYHQQHTPPTYYQSKQKYLEA